MQGPDFKPEVHYKYNFNETYIIHLSDAVGDVKLVHNFLPGDFEESLYFYETIQEVKDLYISFIISIL